MHQNLTPASWYQLSALLPLLVGLAGVGTVPATLVALVVIGPGAPEPWIVLVLGALLSFALVPGLYRTGVEADANARRFRQFSGTLGKKKEPWVEVEDGDYVSIVRVTQTLTPNGVEARWTPRTVAKSKVYFFNQDGHLELFKGDYERSLKLAQRMAERFNLNINDAYT